MKVKILVAALLATAGMSANAAPVAWTGTFGMVQADGNYMDANDGLPGVLASVTGSIDLATKTFSLASTDTFFAANWETHHGQLYLAGETVAVSVADSWDTSGGTCQSEWYVTCAAGTGTAASPAAYPGTITVGANQVLGVVKFGYGTTDGIDVVSLWDVTTDGAGTHYTVANISGWDRIVTGTGKSATYSWGTDAIAGTRMIDGPFPYNTAQFNMTVAAVPEPETYGMMLVGLGILGAAVRRRKAA